jgi:hypothetical protein
VIVLSIAGWLPDVWPKAIVPLTVKDASGAFLPIGTGFLVDHLCNGQHFHCLVTAKHVIMKGDGQPRTDLFLLTNKKGQGVDWLELSSLSSSGVMWKTHPEKDVAAIAVPIIYQTHDVMKFMPEIFEDFSNIKEGDDIFFLGFPLQIGVTANRITPIVRSGMVALRNEDGTFLIDANVFPGNSGSPVFFKPCAFETRGREMKLGQIRQPKLLGLITSYIPYEEVAVSPQTGLPRVSFQENSGLANVLPMRFVLEVLNSSDFMQMLQRVLDRLQQATPKS